MRYVVDIVNEPYIWEHTVLGEKTAIVNYISADDHLVSRHEYAYIDIDVILEGVKRYETIELNHAYLKNVNLNELRNVPYERLYIKQFIANKCFLDGDTDFSICEIAEGGMVFKSCTFGDGDFDLRGSRFQGGILSFEECQFGHGNKYFQGCRFGNGLLDFRMAVLNDGNFYFSQLDINDGTLDFTGAKFGNGHKDFRNMRNRSGTISFKNVEFGKGDVDFVEAEFGEGFLDFRGAQVEWGDVNFGGSKFGNGDKDFSGAQFKDGMVGFSNTNFGHGNAYFIGTEFTDGNVYFSRSKFGEGDVNFIGTVFGNGTVDFNDCNFEAGYLTFNGCKFGTSDVNFSNTDFGQMAILVTGSDFSGGKTLFTDCVAHEITFTEVSFACHVYMNLKRCESLIIENCIIEKTFDLRPTSGHLETYKKMDLRGTKNLGHIYLDWIDSDIRSAIYSQPDSDWLDKAYQFRLLKENFRNIGQYEDEDYAYVEYKRCERRARYSDAAVVKRTENVHPIIRPFAMLKMKIYGTVNYLIFDLIGRFGTSPKNVFFTMIYTVALFTVLYTLPFVNLTRTTKFLLYENQMLRRLALAFYHSTATFLTIGYGDVNPDNFAGTLISAVEGFCGVFLMSYFTVAFVRKILR